MTNFTDEVDALAQLIWDYHHVHHAIEESDCIIVLGSNDPRVASRAAELYRDGLAPLMICTGHVGRLTSGLYAESEGACFARIAIRDGVPSANVTVEDRATNTSENFRFTQQLLAERGQSPSSAIVVTKPYMERRAFATAQAAWSDLLVRVTSPNIPFSRYFTEDLARERIIHLIVGDLQRIRLYAAKGFQVQQDIPPHVWSAFERLVELGYDQHLVDET